MHILISNDDGIWAPGLKVLADALSEIGSITVIAPDAERSTTSHALTLHKPLRMEEIKSGYFSVTGTPADCMYLAVKEILPQKPDLVFMGINRGGNLGNDIHYSGTIAGAREAAFAGLPAAAISLFSKPDNAYYNFEPAAKFAKSLARLMLQHKLPEGVFLNVNVPDLAPGKEVEGIKICSTGHRIYSEEVVQNKDPRGKTYYWIGGAYQGFLDTPHSDCKAVDENYVSVTPLHVDATEYRFLEKLREWDFK